MNRAILHPGAIPAQPWFEDIDLLSRHNICFETCLAGSPAQAGPPIIRYQVYCVERGFESAEEHATGLETDVYDKRALAGLLIHRPSGDAMGTVRLVLPDFAVPGVFPVGELLHENGIELKDYVPLAEATEVSRFAISKNFRRRASDDKEIGASGPGRSERIRQGNLPSLSLIQFLVRHSARNGLQYWVAAMEVKLLRMLHGMGIHFTAIGPQVMHHGLRQPCYCHVPTMLAALKDEQPDYWKVITDGGTLTSSVTQSAA